MNSAFKTVLYEDVLMTLLIEDSPSDALILRSALQDSPKVTFAVTHVTKLAEALETLEQQHFDVVLTDLSLPDSRGLATLKKLRARVPRVPIVVLTGLDDEAVGREALQQGAEEYLIKGELQARTLIRAIRYAIDKTALRDNQLSLERMESVARMAGGIAHEFNNLLTVAELHLATVQEAPLEDSVRASVEELTSVAEAAASLTRQLLTLSTQQVLASKRLDLRALLKEAVPEIGRLVNCDVIFESDQDVDPVWLEADPAMVRQILRSLVLNGSEATEDSGTVRIETFTKTLQPTHLAGMSSFAYSGEFVGFRVLDDGHGIQPEHLDRIWEPFYSTKPGSGGTGLGLAASLAMAKQHGGWIEVESKPQKGARFTVFLPRKESAKESEHRATTDRARQEAPPGEPIILLVEDEPRIRTLSERYLSKNGFAVETAENAEAALKIWAAKKDEIGLLFTDLMLGAGLTGRELAEQLLAERPDLPVLYTSGFSTDFGDKDFELVEDVNFLAKPFNLTELATAVARYLSAE